MNISVPLLSLCLTACAVTGSGPKIHEDLLVTGFPHLPPDARVVAERLASCSHFYGEIGGDPARDNEIMGFLAQLQCGTIDKSVAEIKSKYSGNQAVLESLAQAGGL